MDNRATFFCRLNYVEVRGNLGRGEQFFDGFFVTNDRERISSLVPPNMRGALGTLEYNSFLKSPLAAYCTIDNLKQGSEQEKLTELLMILDSFESAFWLHSDNCVGHELAFLVKGQSIFSNVYEGLRTFSDGRAHRSIQISADQIRDIVRFYRKMLRPDNIAPVRYHSTANSSRFSRALSHVHRAQRTAFLPEKITFYCSALEALLSTAQAELAHQIGERVALISVQGVEERVELYRFLKECYSFRSKYIHGSPLKEVGDGRLIKLSTRMDDAVRRCMKSLLADGDLFLALSDEKALDEHLLRRIFQ